MALETATGTPWEGAEAAAYEVAKHGPDGKKFLDAYLYPALASTSVRGMRAIDIGSGTGPWTEFLSKQGAELTVGIDFNEDMLKKGTETRFQRDLIEPFGHHIIDSTKLVLLGKGTAAKLPHPDDSFNIGISINVGCNLPPDAFEAHFSEAYRVMRPGGTFVVTAPNSLTDVFTDGADVSTMQERLNDLWERSTDHSPQQAKSLLKLFKHVLRATFVLDPENGTPTLITKENAGRLVKSGTPILRIIPGVVVDNVYHTADEYVEAAKAAGWQIDRNVAASFADERELAAYNEKCGPDEKLGPEYIGHPPFLFLKLRKPGAAA